MTAKVYLSTYCVLLENSWHFSYSVLESSIPLPSFQGQCSVISLTGSLVVGDCGDVIPLDVHVAPCRASLWSVQWNDTGNCYWNSKQTIPYEVPFFLGYFNCSSQWTQIPFFSGDTLWYCDLALPDLQMNDSSILQFVFSNIIIDCECGISVT